jgi:hypothetical protein
MPRHIPRYGLSAFRYSLSATSYPRALSTVMAEWYDPTPGNTTTSADDIWEGDDMSITPYPQAAMAFRTDRTFPAP